MNTQNPAIIAALLDAGAELNARTKDGHTPLHVAAEHTQKPAVIAALLDARADPKARDERGKVPWDFAERNPALKDSNVYWRLNEGRF